MRSGALFVTAILASTACKSGDAGNASGTDAAAKTDPVAADSGKVDPQPGDTVPSESAGGPAATTDDPPPPTTATNTDGARDEGEAAEAGDEAGGTGAAEAGDEATQVDPIPPLLKEIKNKRTKDARALEALAEAEKLGVEPGELAKAANARAKALFADPERAKKFFEWAAEKDETYADPVFNLARQAVMAGDIPTTKELLAQVRKRKGGKKLLQQLDFDPTWDIVKDDSDVRALMK